MGEARAIRDVSRERGDPGMYAPFVVDEGEPFERERGPGTVL